MNETDPESGREDFRYEDLTSTREAARLLRVSESTVWRWINQERIPAYRVGDKRVWLRRGDLESLVSPARRFVAAARNKRTDMTDRERLNLTAMGYRRTSDEVERARAVREALLAKRGGRLIAEAWEDIAEAREERSEAL